MDLQQILFYLEIIVLTITVSFQVIYDISFGFINGSLLGIGLVLLVINIIKISKKSQIMMMTFIGENLKKLIIISLIAYISKQFANAQILKFADKYYDASFLIFLLFTTFYFIDNFIIYKFTNHKINNIYQ